MTLSNYFALNVDPSQALPETYNWGLVLLSYLVAVLGSYAFLQFATRIAELRDAGLRYSWLVIGAIAMGGGIWAMHFIGMLAHILPIPVAYDPWITALSIVPAILGAGVALHVVARPVITTSRLLIGGTLMGAGIGAMHYTGMMAMQLNALVRYDPTLFAASIVVAVLLAVLALQVRQVISKLNLSRFGAVRDGVGALIMGFAVTAMHYTAMASTYCFATPGPHRTPVDHSVFAGVTALIASLVLLLTIVAVMFDRRVAQEASSHRRTSEQLLQAQKMEAVGQLTGGVAHDFNNILTIVLANADAILDDDSVPAHITKRAQRISDAGQKASELTRQLLAFSRKQVLKPEVSDLNDLVASTGRLLRRTLGEHIVVQTTAAPNLWPIYVDRPQVETSLINLCINARDAMPTGGRLTIETRTSRCPGTTWCGWRTRSRRASTPCCRSATPVPACRPTSAGASSSRSSPPRRWARGPALASAWSTASSASRTAISRSPASWAAAPPFACISRAAIRRRPPPRRRAGRPCRAAASASWWWRTRRPSAPSSASSSAAWATT